MPGRSSGDAADGCSGAGCLGHCPGIVAVVALSSNPAFFAVKFSGFGVYASRRRICWRRGSWDCIGRLLSARWARMLVPVDEDRFDFRTRKTSLDAPLNRQRVVVVRYSPPIINDIILWSVHDCIN